MHESHEIRKSERLPTEEVRFCPARCSRVEESESSTIYSVGRVASSRLIEDKGMIAATLRATKAANGKRSVGFISLRRPGIKGWGCRRLLRLC